jgi:prepilin-type N-terminal cleavage/methylation domain-containing protein
MLMVVQSPSRLTGRNAYTLLEMVLVTAVIGMLAAMSVPVMTSLQSHTRIQAGVDAVRAAWAQGRAKAIEEGRPYRFAVVMGKSNFRLAPDRADSWNGGNAPSSDPAGPGLVREGALPKGVVFADKDQAGPTGTDTVVPAGHVGQGMWADVAVFQPDGTAREDVEIAFQVQGSRGMVIRLRALTGAVSVKPLGGSN